MRTVNLKMTPDSPQGNYGSHWTDTPTNFPLAEGNLCLNLSLELERLKRAKPLVTEHGIVFMNRRPTPSSYQLGIEFRCYDAALTLAMEFEHLTYCEGFVVLDLGQMVSMAHGWCVDPEGNIVDPTFFRHQMTNRLLYWGIPFKTNYVKEQAADCGYVGLLDGRLDGKPTGVYFDAPKLWKEDIHVC